jgi:WD40 repeat protein
MRFLRRQPPPPPSSNLTATLTGHSMGVVTVGFSPDGRVLASGSADRTVVLWDVTDPAHPDQQATLSHPRPGMGTSRRGSRGRAGGVRAVAFSPDGRVLASGSADRTVVLWDVTDPAHPDQHATLTGIAGSRRAGLRSGAVRFSPDGRLLACDAGGKMVALWDVADPAHPDQRAVLAHRYGLYLTARVQTVGFSPDGRLLATGAGPARNAVVLWDVADPGHPAQIATIRRRFKRTGTDVNEASTVTAVAFSPDGRLLATGSGQTVASEYATSSCGAVVLWDVTDPAHPVRAATLPAGGVWVRAVAFSPDGRVLASGEGATVILWDVTDPVHPAATATLTGHGGEVLGVAFSPDGQLLASCGADKTVRLWEMG